MNQDTLDKLAGTKEVLGLYFDRLVSISKESDRRYRALCPFHDEKTPSFNVYFAEGKWLFKCWGCNETGNIFQFIEQVDGIKFNDAVRVVEDANKESWDQVKNQVDTVFKSAFDDAELPKKTYTLADYEGYEKNLEANQAARDWLFHQRGITYETAKRLHWGFVQSRSFFKAKPELADKGWISFPYITDGVITAIKFRSIADKAFDQMSGMTTKLYRTQGAIDWSEVVYLVEGELDAAVFIQAGLAVCALPSAQYKLTPEEKDYLFDGNQIILAGDMDGKAGEVAMQSIQRELDSKRVTYLRWPTGYKDANDFFINFCQKDSKMFKVEVVRLTNLAKMTVMKDITDMKQLLLSGLDTSSLVDDPRRLRFPWKDVDEMSVLLPGSVLCLFAGLTGMGKTCFAMNFSIHCARKHGEVVLNYQCELKNEEMANMITAFLVKKDRRKLTAEDHKLAGYRMGGARYYVGNSPELDRLGPVLDLIENAIKRLGVTVAILDHIHYICRNEPNEVQALANGMQRIKRMAQKYGVKFVVLGQPRKANQESVGKAKTISDAKGSETFGSDADTVMIMERKQITNINLDNPPEDEFEAMTVISCPKTRSKGIGKAYTKLDFAGEQSSFYDKYWKEHCLGR